MTKPWSFRRAARNYLKPLWAAQGWQEGQTVWRLEFELKRQALAELGVQVISDLRPNLGGLWAYATGSWLRLTDPNPADATQTRWPTHPLWAALSALDWGNPSAPSLSRVRLERIPADEALFVNGLGGITSFMAREGITDLGEGLGEFLAHAERFHEHRARSGAPSLKDYISHKVALKGKRYNSLHNPNPAAEEARRERAKAYRKASDGE